MAQLSNMSKGKIFDNLPLLLTVILIIVIAIYFIYMEIIGVMVLHELSAWRAILGVFIIPVIIVVIIGLLLFAFFFALFSALGNSITGAVGGLL